MTTDPSPLAEPAQLGERFAFGLAEIPELPRLGEREKLWEVRA
jgi:hypothetical protein